MSRFAFEFTARVSAFDLGPWSYSVVFLPAELAGQLPLDENPRLRIRGEIGEYPFAGACQPTGGRWYLILSKAFLKKMDASVGEWIHVRFNIDDQNAVDIPEPLAAELKRDKAFAKAWGQLTPGKQRSYLVPISQAKTPATIAKRIAGLRAAVLAN